MVVAAADGVFGAVSAVAVFSEAHILGVSSVTLFEVTWFGDLCLAFPEMVLLMEADHTVDHVVGLQIAASCAVAKAVPVPAALAEPSHASEPFGPSFLPSLA